MTILINLEASQFVLRIRRVMVQAQ
ncbi:uncharacterized protein METZ01_LOCUS324719 [marine metagenome]|uniref:Uncharacterized protein n=1 Tax=marine metagenome TaxID=408172 RepID=A0A382PGW3_9ZZZZ